MPETQLSRLNKPQQGLESAKRTSSWTRGNQIEDQEPDKSLAREVGRRHQDIAQEVHTRLTSPAQNGRQTIAITDLRPLKGLKADLLDLKRQRFVDSFLAKLALGESVLQSKCNSLIYHELNPPLDFIDHMKVFAARWVLSLKSYEQFGRAWLKETYRQALRLDFLNQSDPEALEHLFTQRVAKGSMAYRRRVYDGLGIFVVLQRQGYADKFVGRGRSRPDMEPLMKSFISGLDNTPISRGQLAWNIFLRWCYHTDCDVLLLPDDTTIAGIDNRLFTLLYLASQSPDPYERELRHALAKKTIDSAQDLRDLILCFAGLEKWMCEVEMLMNWSTLLNVEKMIMERRTGLSDPARIEVELNQWVNEAGPCEKRLEAAQRVRTCLTEKCECLDLTGLNLSSIPAVIIALTELRTLHFEAASLEHFCLSTYSLSYFFPKLEKLLVDNATAVGHRSIILRP